MFTQTLMALGSDVART